ncbi:thioether cross-link-forming SCIFF peptide maturase [Peptoniphilus equinus]|uniref:Thioether cross-link-forming SCIFF peptide maturase n=1 Tax=Peptoniphilus equinus TaxID=3016343 RepID=A0ABY7QX29_9FIRM|nr:thioether cross-link-forming SCIFF peptide maturase [Peptoniphilus equinus]WBW50650.1 thioether cross-link-forming SCIFF peptide maturase [Peptoniphilus equinus]
MKQIHKFHLNNKYVVIDVGSGSVHVVDELFYRALDFLDSDNPKASFQAVREGLKGDDPDKVQETLEEIEALIDQDVLFSEDMNIQTPAYNPQNIVKALCLHVAHDCNLRCRYCFASQGDFHGERLLMDEATGKKALDFLLENSGNRKHLEVDFFGGEPLMNFDLVKTLVAYGREREKIYGKEFRFTITTNGLLLDDDKIDFINEHMSNVVLSLDGRPEVNDSMRPTISGDGSYDIIVPKFKRLIEKRGDKDYYIRGTFTNENLDFAKDLKTYYDAGFKSTSLEPVVTDESMPYAIREEHLETILKEYEKMSADYIVMRQADPDFKFFHFMIDLSGGPCVIKRTVGCGAGSEYIAVTPEGDIYPCHQFVGETDFKLGNVHEGVTNTAIRDEFKCANVFTKTDCPTCWARYYCSGGCHANSHYANHDLKVPHKIGCEMERKRIECAISVLANESD